MVVTMTVTGFLQGLAAAGAVGVGAGYIASKFTAEEQKVITEKVVKDYQRSDKRRQIMDLSTDDLRKLLAMTRKDDHNGRTA